MFGAFWATPLLPQGTSIIPAIRYSILCSELVTLALARSCWGIELPGRGARWVEAGGNNDKLRSKKIKLPWELVAWLEGRTVMVDAFTNQFFSSLQSCALGGGGGTRWMASAVLVLLLLLVHPSLAQPLQGPAAGCRHHLYMDIGR